MEDIRELQRFAHRRKELIEHADQTGGDVDQWLKSFANTRPPMSELGRFETLLVHRRDALEALMRLDDHFIQYLVEHRHDASIDGSKAGS